MTPEAVDEFVAETQRALPDGYFLDVDPQQPFEFRNLWRIRVLDADGNRLWGRAAYPSALLDGIVAAKRWAWEQSRAA